MNGNAPTIKMVLVPPTNAQKKKKCITSSQKNNKKKYLTNQSLYAIIQIQGEGR